MPLLAMLDMLAVGKRSSGAVSLSAIIDAVLECEPGDVVLLKLQLDLKLPYPESAVGMDATHIHRRTDRERLLQHYSRIHGDLILVTDGSFMVSLIPGDIDAAEVPIA